MSAGAGDNGGAMMAGGIGQLADGDETELSKHTHARTECPRQPHTLVHAHTHSHTDEREGRRAERCGRLFRTEWRHLFFERLPLVWDPGWDSTIASTICAV